MPRLSISKDLYRRRDFVRAVRRHGIDLDVRSVLKMSALSDICYDTLNRKLDEARADTLRVDELIKLGRVGLMSAEDLLNLAGFSAEAKIIRKEKERKET